MQTAHRPLALHDLKKHVHLDSITPVMFGEVHH